MALRHTGEHRGTQRGQLMGGGHSDFAEHLEFGCSLSSQASSIVEKVADGVSGNTHW